MTDVLLFLFPAGHHDQRRDEINGRYDGCGAQGESQLFRDVKAADDLVAEHDPGREERDQQQIEDQKQHGEGPALSAEGVDEAEDGKDERKRDKGDTAVERRGEEETDGLCSAFPLGRTLLSGSATTIIIPTGPTRKVHQKYRASAWPFMAAIR